GHRKVVLAGQTRCRFAQAEGGGVDRRYFVDSSVARIHERAVDRQRQTDVVRDYPPHLRRLGGGHGLRRQDESVPTVTALRWHEFPDAAAVAEEAARRVLEAARRAIALRGVFRVVLAGGS